MECPNCRHQNREGAKFCEECGAKLQSICPECGSELRPQAKFCDECGARVAEADTTATEAASPTLEDVHAQSKSWIPDELAQKYMSAEQQATGENRPITALFADISGFTSLSNTQSSETIFQLVQGCFRELVGVIARYEGSVSGFRGDGLLALFGAPILHENDAERAILAAMDMRDAIQEQGLNVSIGVNTAMMTVGEIQTQLHSEYTAYGTDINLAKRLQESSEPGQILVGVGTHRLTRRMFDFDLVTGLNVKGFQESVTAYSVQQVKERPEKLRGIEGLRARMIGREHEFSDLKDAADAWLDGRGQIVSIIGEAGIGKSRLVSELREYLKSKSDKETRGQGERETRGQGVEENIPLSPRLPLPLSPCLPLPLSLLEGRCVFIGQPISYWPFLDILRAYFQLGENDDEPTRARKVTESIAQLMPKGADEALPLLGNLLSIKFGNELDDRLKFASSEQIRHQTLMRLRDLFETLARQQPLLLILEDLHWADDLSLDLISLLMDELVNTPLMLLCVYRPEKEHRVWQLGDQARRKCLDRYTELTLQPLSSHESRLLVGNLLTIDNLPESTKEAMLTKSEGNPFFIEEVIRSLIEQDMIYREGENWKARDEIASVSVPDTIQSVVLARVDRLQSEAKYVLQCASVIGRLFKHRLLQHISRQERDLDRYINEFEDKELIYEERTVPELEYAFKHAFTQEATYEGILEQKRKEFHHQVADGIERLYQERLDEYYEELAHHYSRSEDVEKAVEYLLKAGAKAKVSYANESAISYFQQALDILAQRGMERNDWKLEALRGLGQAYLLIGSYIEAESVSQEALELGKGMKLTPRRLAWLYADYSYAIFRQGRNDEGIQQAEAGLDILGDDNQCLEAAMLYSRIAMCYGRKGDAKSHWEYTQRHMLFISDLPYSEELALCYVNIVESILWMRDLDAARRWCEELEERARQSHDLVSLAWVYSHKANILRSSGDYKNSLLFRQKRLDTSKRMGDRQRIVWSYFGLVETLLALGRIEEAELRTQEYMDMGVRNAGLLESIPLGYRLSGDIAMIQRYWDQAISDYQRYVKKCRSIGVPDITIEALLRLGQAYLRKGDYECSLKYFREAADVATTAVNETNSVKASSERVQTYLLPGALAGAEEAYIALNTPEKFVAFCKSYTGRWSHLTESPFQQWYLKQVESSTDFTHDAFTEDFGTQVVDQSWLWVDEFGDCSYRIISGSGLEICSANGRDLWHLNLSAPRLIRRISGDFAAEICISPASDDKPQIGGLLVWKDKDNFLRFEKGVHGRNEIRLEGYVDGEYRLAGRGILVADEDQEIHLRLKRSGDVFTSYCGTDGENWFTYGKETLPMEDPIQVGIHAIGMINRTIYCGEYKEGTATIFRNFRIWTRE